MAIFTTLRGEIHNSIYHKLQNSMEVDSVGIIAILSMSYTTPSIVKTDKCGLNSQSARRKPNYHTKCGKNCHKILSVWVLLKIATVQPPLYGSCTRNYCSCYRRQKFLSTVKGLLI